MKRHHIIALLFITLCVHLSARDVRESSVRRLSKPADTEKRIVDTANAESRRVDSSYLEFQDESRDFDSRSWDIEPFDMKKNSEKSSVFIGGNFNFAMYTRDGYGRWGTQTPYYYYEAKGSQNGYVAGLGLILGYKHFMTDNIGIRGYVGLDGNMGMVEIINQRNLSFYKEVEAAFYTKLSLNLDILWNYSTSEYSSQGVFAGVNFIKYSFGDTFAANAPVTNNSSSGLGFNLGWRSKTKQNNIEIGINIPVVKKTIMSQSSLHEISMQENIAVFVRYIYDFEF